VHGPHQAPEEYVAKYKHLGKNAAQRAQMECLDVAVGRVLDAITRKGIVEKTLVIFTNDNGGTRVTSNGPYKGFKSDYHEGGIRVPFAARWPGVIPKGATSNEMLHIVDLFPTLCRLAGANPDRGLPLDGKDAWATIASGAKSPRQEIAHSLDVLRQGRWKLIEDGAQYYNWGPEPLQLYDIETDPYEKRNLASDKPEIVQKMAARLKELEKDAREGEKLEKIPNHPPVVYGERENALWGDEVRKKLEPLNIAERDATKRGEEQ
jgi:arylsulfatase A-like enzyme